MPLKSRAFSGAMAMTQRGWPHQHLGWARDATRRRARDNVAARRPRTRRRRAVDNGERLQWHEKPSLVERALLLWRRKSSARNFYARHRPEIAAGLK